MVLGANGDIADYHESDKQDGREHSKIMRLTRWADMPFRPLWARLTEDFKGTATVLATIGVGLAVAHVSAPFSERARTVSSIVLGCFGSLLVVDSFRDKLVSQIRYIVLGTTALIVGVVSYPPLSAIHQGLVHHLAAGACGGTVVFAYECVKRLRRQVEGRESEKEVSSDMLISVGCALIAIAAVIAISSQ